METDFPLDEHKGISYNPDLNRRTIAALLDWVRRRHRPDVGREMKSLVEVMAWIDTDLLKEEDKKRGCRNLLSEIRACKMPTTRHDVMGIRRQYELLEATFSGRVFTFSGHTCTLGPAYNRKLSPKKWLRDNADGLLLDLRDIPVYCRHLHEPKEFATKLAEIEDVENKPPAEMRREILGKYHGLSAETIRVHYLLKSSY